MTLPELAGPSEFGAVDDRDRLLRALATLPKRTRAALALRYFEDLPDAEIAKIMGCSVSTVKSSVSRGLARLREHHLLADSDALTASIRKEG
jgi:RNA polymerase sigma factor (sigma-70 family)